ncbi:MAG: DNA-binding protein, partial [Dehalococcoidia bacterium]|nr:DNA-binding protein [Dehalococcoidia bacterium]
QRRGMPLSQAIQAFTFFRRSLDETAKQLAERNRMSPEEAAGAREQIAGLADRVLLSLTAVYDH